MPRPSVNFSKESRDLLNHFWVSEVEDLPQHVSVGAMAIMMAHKQNLLHAYSFYGKHEMLRLTFYK